MPHGSKPSNGIISWSTSITSLLLWDVYFKEEEVRGLKGDFTVFFPSPPTLQISSGVVDGDKIRGQTESFTRVWLYQYWVWKVYVLRPNINNKIQKTGKFRGIQLLSYADFPTMKIHFIGDIYAITR